MKGAGRVLVSLIAALMLVACGGNPQAPIEDHSARRGAAGAQQYAVQRGDTLYSIAFRYGLDYRRLAAANRISEPYTIYVGQSLVLSERAAPAPAPAKPSRRSGANDSGASPSSKPVVTPAPAVAKRADTRASTASAASKPTTATAATPLPNQRVGAWLWPNGGRLVRRFDGERHKGLDIAGKRGDTIRATAAGRVVYAGSGIVGYGLVLIVRHNDEYLSAYGHNDALLVEEGDDVDAGQAIARMGSSGTDTVKLHFELRRRGRPVDPLTLLPKR